MCGALALSLLAPQARAITVTDETTVEILPGALEFHQDPDAPDFGDVTLDGTLQTRSVAMSDHIVKDATGSGSGWNVTVEGDTGPGQSPVLAEYCTDGAAANGCDDIDGHGTAGPGYVSGGEAFAAESMALDSSGAATDPVSGTTGPAPAFDCSGGCPVDAPEATRIEHASADAGMGRWQADFESDSLVLTIPTTTKVVDAEGAGNKVYKVDLLFSLNSGPS